MTTMARPSKKPTELRRRDFPALLRRRTYSDGKPRPLLRGVLHGCVSACLAPRRRAAARAGRRAPPARAGGCCSAPSPAAARATARRPRCTRAVRERRAPRPSRCGSTSRSSRRASGARCRRCAATAPTGRARSRSAPRSRRSTASPSGGSSPDTSGSSTPHGRRTRRARRARRAVCLDHRGDRPPPGFDAPWAAGVALYLAAFALSAEVTVAHEREPMSPRVPWHRAGRGLHGTSTAALRGGTPYARRGRAVPLAAGVRRARRATFLSGNAPATLKWPVAS